MFYLNVPAPKLLFQRAKNSQIFVDKSLLIENVSKQINTNEQYICVTRPRRFGKTINANMLAAYYTKGLDSGSLFAGLEISKQKTYPEHLNQHNVVRIDFSQMPDDCRSYTAYISDIQNMLRKDLGKAYPHLDPLVYSSLSSLFEATGDSFIFILDEWDAIFHKRFLTEEDREEFLEFLRKLLKDKAYVELAYMTGVLPIAKYSSGSALNMFREDHALKHGPYERFFGFTKTEVQALCKERQTICYQELKQWYDGYQMKD